MGKLTEKPKLALGADWMVPVRIASVACQVNYRARFSSNPKYPEARRYYAGAVQVAFAEIGKECCMLHLTDSLMAERSIRCATEKAIVQHLQEALSAIPK